MKFANRMDRFGEGVFSMLAQMKKKKLEEGETIVDLSIGAPNIAPAPHILKALSDAWCRRITCMQFRISRRSCRQCLTGMSAAMG